ncbi:MAG: DNA gyrase subunit A [Ruminococcaceae bacterium]|nr:DNA gyrase subunit A [Oscillospiraceae bacterium]
MDINIEGMKIENVEIEHEIKRSYIDYAMSVIVGRALPDVRDGLKPVHRRILYSMYDDNLTHDKPFRKSATTVGNVLGHYHPHGDASVYDAMVRLAQPFSMRYPLVEGHGNFGNVDGDPAAAYRYTEARLNKIASEMMADIEKNVVDFEPNFDNKLMEPTVLPAKFPNLLVNGSVGIAVGMATNIPPHNMTEVIDGTIYLMENPDASVADLMKIIKGPDFPTSATIHGTAGICEAYTTGRGKVLVRAKHKFEERGNRTSIVFTEIPYMVNKSELVKSIAECVNSKRIEGVSDLRDESGRGGMRIVVDLKKDANPQLVLNLLFKYTRLQDTFAVNMLALVDKEPKTLSLKQMLKHYIDHREDVTVRRLNYELDKAKARLHILEGLKTAIDNIEEVIRIIRSCRSVAEAKAALIERFDFSDIQGQAIVDMPLGRLSGLEIEKIINEMEEKQALIEKLVDILSHEEKIFAIIKEELEDIKSRYGDERRTEIEAADDDLVYEDLIERKRCVVTMSETGYIKRIPLDTYQAQNRGGKGITGMTTKDEDSVRDMFIADSHSYLMMFTDKGKLFVKKCYEIPEASRSAKGMNLVNILNISEGERVTAVISVPKLTSDNYLTMVTKNGTVKRCPVSDFKRIKKTGLIALKLEENDELLFVCKTDGNMDLLVTSSEGRSVRYSESLVRVMGRTAKGVRAIRLSDGESVVGACALNADIIIDDENDLEIDEEALNEEIVETAEEASDASGASLDEEGDDDIDTSEDFGAEEVEHPGKYVLTITENGFGKRTDSASFPRKGRGGKGVISHKVTEKTGKVAGTLTVDDGDEIMLMTDSGMIIRTEASQISVTGRNASGVIVMRMSDGARIVGIKKC